MDKDKKKKIREHLTKTFIEASNPSPKKQKVTEDTLCNFGVFGLETPKNFAIAITNALAKII